MFTVNGEKSSTQIILFTVLHDYCRWSINIDGSRTWTPCLHPKFTWAANIYANRTWLPRMDVKHPRESYIVTVPSCDPYVIIIPPYSHLPLSPNRHRSHPQSSFLHVFNRLPRHCQLAWLLLKLIFICRLKTAETRLTQFYTNLRHSIWNHGLRITQLQSWVKAHNAWAYHHTTGLRCNKVYMRPSLSWDISRRISVVRYRRFGRACRSHVLPSSPSTLGILRPPLTHGLASLFLWTNHCPRHSLYITAPLCSGHSSWTAWALKVGLIGSTETSVTNHQYNLRNNQDERRPHSQRGGSFWITPSVVAVGWCNKGFFDHAHGAVLSEFTRQYTVSLTDLPSLPIMQSVSRGCCTWFTAASPSDKTNAIRISCCTTVRRRALFLS